MNGQIELIVGEGTHLVLFTLSHDLCHDFRLALLSRRLQK